VAHVTIDDDRDLDGLRRAGRAVADACDEMLAAVAPGITTARLDEIGGEVLARHGARSAPMLTYGFPGQTCISVNADAAHGIPSAGTVLRGGDLVNIDVSAELDGYWADTGASTAVGSVDPARQHLLAATRRAQSEAMNAARAGKPLRHVGRAVERCARRHGLQVVANLAGHGIGRGLHEWPSVPSVEDRSDRTMLHEGLVLAIEPFLTTGPPFVVDADDGWTLRTPLGDPIAQFEHTVVVTAGRPIVLTAPLAV